MGLAAQFSASYARFRRAAYVPDVAVYRWARIPFTDEGEVADDFTEPPDIAVEIISPGQSVTGQVRRCVWYVEHGVEVALLVDTVDRVVLLFRPNAVPRALEGTDSIDLADVVPRFEATVEQLFSALRS